MPRPIPITPTGPTGGTGPTAPSGPTAATGPTAPAPDPAPVPVPPPAPAPAPPPPANVLANLTGTVQTKRANGTQPYGVPWANIVRYAPEFIAAANEFGRDPLLLAAMAIVESDGNQFDGAGRVISRTDASGGGPSVGIMQVKPAIWQNLLPNADPTTVRGNIRLGAAIMTQAINQYGSWQQAIKRVYFPAADPNGTSQNAYVETVAALMAEMKGITPAPKPQVDPLAVIVGGSYGPITYGFGANAGLDYYAYGTGHGTGGDTQHTGVDVPVPRGTTLHAPLAGKVLCVGSAGDAGWGNACGAYADADGSGRSGNLTILLDVGSRLTLGHCQSFLVSVGQRVDAGQAVAKSGGMNGPHVHVEMAICDRSRVNCAVAHDRPNCGCYFLVEPVAALKAAMGGAAPPVYAERLPVPQPSEWDVFCEVKATQDGVPVLQRADLGAAPVRAPLAKGETFDAVMLVLGNDRHWYWISSLGSRIPLPGTSAPGGPVVTGAQ